MWIRVWGGVRSGAVHGIGVGGDVVGVIGVGGLGGGK